ncbi:MATE family efflux transporter [Desulfobaculum sp. SPO524]|uniref:MATE family efflux transporter n=1 Tax=Desulfobaculum sp. SPO524 TaxID=3378071 RepID=UPI003851E4FE
MSYLKALRQEAPDIFKIFGPLLISQYAQIANGIIDTAMAARLGTTDLGGVAVGVAIWMPVYMFVIGLLISVLILVAQRHGAGDKQGAVDLGHQGLWMGGILGVVASCIIIGLSQYATWYGADASLMQASRAYIWAVAWGFPLGAMAVSLRFFCEGQNVVFPVTVMAVIIVFCNAVLNYALMFGKLGAPALGIQGCGLATAISMVILFVLLTGYIALSKNFVEVRFMRHFQRINFKIIKQFFTLGLPIAFGITSEYLVASVITIFISTTTVTAVAAHQVAFSCMMLFFATPAALSMASSIRVGNLWGESHHEQARTAIKGIMTLSVLIGGAFTVLMLVASLPLARMFSTDMAVVLLAASALRFGAFFQLADSIQVCLNGILRGVGDTKIPFMLTAVVYWLVCIPVGYVLSGMPLPWGLGLSADVLGIRGWWLALTITLFIVSLLLAHRVRNTFWAFREPSTEPVSVAG